MKRFILCPRNGIYIIDLNKTIESLDKFIVCVEKEVEKGGKVLFIGTKRQIKDSLQEEAIRCGMPYVTERWLGGMLTNFQTIRQSIAKLEKIENMESEKILDALPKKEVLKILKKKEKLLLILNGVRDLKKPPSLIYVVDSTKEHIAVNEACRLKIPIGAIVDTNCDPDKINFPIPANDDAIKSVQLITKAIADAIVSINKKVKIKEMEEEAKTESREDVEKVDTDVAEKRKEDRKIRGEEKAKSHFTKRRVVRKKTVKASDD